MKYMADAGLWSLFCALVVMVCLAGVLISSLIDVFFFSGQMHVAKWFVAVGTIAVECKHSAGAKSQI